MLLLNLKLAFSHQISCIILACFLFIGCGTVKNVIIPPKQELIIGEGGNSVFDIKISNQGNTATRLSETLEHGEKIDLGFIPGGDRRKLTFLSGSTAELSNVLSDTVYLKLRILSPEVLETRMETIQ